MKIEKMIDSDYIADGWKKVDPKKLSDNPPKIAWGNKYLEWDDTHKISYLEKLAHSMNHATDLLQGERNELNVLCEKKEKQIEIMKRAVEQNMEMVQSEITRMNSEKQEMLKTIAARNKRIKELECQSSQA